VDQRLDGSPRHATIVLVVLALALSNACGPRLRTEGAEQLAAPDTVKVMTAQDGARLEAIAQKRAGEAPGGYRIGPDDLLDVRIPDLLAAPADRGVPGMGQNGPWLPVVAQAPVFQQGLRVDGGGAVTVPMIGSLTAEGLTPSELEREIARRLTKRRILRTPQVSVQVVEYRSRVVAVVGSVERPGLYPLTRPGATVADLIWAAGGPTKEAGRVVEFAPATGADPGDTEPMRVDLETLLHANGVRDRSLDPPVRPGDVITISPVGNVLVDGWVGKPGSYPVTRGLTVSGAVAAAGGELFPANLHRVTLARQIGPGHQSLPVDLDAVAEGHKPDLPITDGDIVRVPASSLRVPPWVLWSLVQSMVRFGGTVAY
jgi:polysaccharide biosynthesis/export protein